jgi:hypothetical protein
MQEMLKTVFCDNALGRTQNSEWCFQTSVEHRDHLGRPSAGCWDEIKEGINKIIRQYRRSTISKIADRSAARMQHSNKQKSGKPCARIYSIGDRSVMNHDLESLEEICRSLITVIMGMAGRSYTYWTVC